MKVKDMMDHFNVKIEDYDKTYKYAVNVNGIWVPKTKRAKRLTVTSYHGTEQILLNNINSELFEYSIIGPYSYFIFLNKRGKMVMYVIDLTSPQTYSSRQIYRVNEGNWDDYRGKFEQYTKIETSGLNPKILEYLVARKV